MIWTAFILGLISSFHCVGMCGPLAMALPVQGLTIFKKNIAIILYHTGRVVTYTSMGLLFGLFGRHLFIAGYQQWVSVLVGAIILIVLLQQYIFRKKTDSFINQKISSVLYKWMHYAWNMHSSFSALVFGMINGLLPCGMVYYALAGAFSTGSVKGSLIFMALFGAGTLPLMLSAHFLGASYITISVRNGMKKMVPVIIGCMGVLLILRGLNLGIPFISPFLGNKPGQAVWCH